MKCVIEITLSAMNVHRGPYPYAEINAFLPRGSRERARHKYCVKEVISVLFRRFLSDLCPISLHLTATRRETQNYEEPEHSQVLNTCFWFGILQTLAESPTNKMTRFVIFF